MVALASTLIHTRCKFERIHPPTLMTMALPANTAATRGLSTLWKGQFQGTMAPT